MKHLLSKLGFANRGFSQVMEIPEIDDTENVMYKM